MHHAGNDFYLIRSQKRKKGKGKATKEPGGRGSGGERKGKHKRALLITGGPSTVVVDIRPCRFCLDFDPRNERVLGRRRTCPEEAPGRGDNRP